jgi:hypothetical protein
MPPHRPHFTSPHPSHLSPTPLLPPHTIKRARADSPPPTSRWPQNATRAHGASAEPLEAHDATKTKTKRNKTQHIETRARSQGSNPRLNSLWSLACKPSASRYNAASTRPRQRQRRHKHVQTPTPTLQAIFFLAPHTSGPRDVPRCGALN